MGEEEDHKKPNQSKLRFDIQGIKDLDVAWKFQATNGAKVAPFIGLKGSDLNMHSMINTYYAAVTDIARYRVRLLLVLLLLSLSCYMCPRLLNLTTLFLDILRPPRRITSSKCPTFARN